jgi:hypothetical protein
MGILDDAIRQHLELKRRLGADDDELKQLEDEAFGPPARPGEPDFPGYEGDDGDDAAQGTVDVVVAPPETAESPVAYEAEDEGFADEEPSATEHAVVEAPPADEAEEGGEARFFDQSLEDELDLSDLDLELDEDEDLEDVPAAAAAPPIETLETEEHSIEEFEDDDEDEGDEDALEAAPAEPAPADEVEATEGEEEDEDVLADTPEFLRDAPEDDELWFEQGKPKDFDFDE